VAACQAWVFRAASEQLRRRPCETYGVGYTIVRPEDRIFGRPSWRPEETVREIVELNRHANLSYSRANLWRYPAGARGRRHRETVQEEVFIVLEGSFAMLLGDPPERVELPAGTIVVVEPETPLQVLNAGESEGLLFAYGAPPEEGRAEILEEP
jgi:mannose-6-phosphate isomerase-like protein (cupin superfamily)